MRHIPILLAVLTIAGCRPDVAYEGDDYEIGQPITHGNLTIFTITSRQPLTEDRFITLDEGLKAGTVKVFEVGSEDGTANNSNIEFANPNPNDAPNVPPVSEPQPTPDGGDADPFTVTNDPRAIAPRPPVVDGVADGDLDQPLPPSSDNFELYNPSSDDNAAQTADLDNLQYNQGNFDLQFTQGGGRDVNRLMVVNTSDRPLYLMPGEVIIGGSQDRTIGQELVIAPSGKPVAVDVFCVESERWSDRQVDQTVAEINAASQGALSNTIAVAGDADAQEAAKEIAQGKFIASVGNLNKGARLALQKTGEQGKVWDEVAIQNANTKVAAGSATFTANYSNAEFNDRLNPYIEALHDSVANQKNVVGVIVAVDGKVESMDMFESTPLFQKLWPKLLKSYALDAATQQASMDEAATEPPKAATVADARSFFGKATRGEITKTDRSGDLAADTRENDDVICFTSRQLDALASEDASADAAPAMGGFGGGVHTSAFAH